MLSVRVASFVVVVCSPAAQIGLWASWIFTRIAFFVGVSQHMVFQGYFPGESIIAGRTQKPQFDMGTYLVGTESQLARERLSACAHVADVQLADFMD